MSTLDGDLAAGRLENGIAPCLSLFQSTHRRHPENQQDPIRFRNLVKRLEKSLLRQFSKEDIRPLLSSFLALADDRDFWNHTFDGLAVLGATGFFRAYTLQRPVRELAVVADSFHIKPLIRILQSADRYQVLGLNRQEAELFEGNRDALDEVELDERVPRTIAQALGEELTEPHQTVASYGGVGAGRSPMHHGHGGRKEETDIDAERFFRAVDRAILECHSRPSGLPLILAALPEHHHLFHEVSQNRFLIAETIDVHPDALPSLDEFRRRAWNAIEPYYRARLAARVEEFREARAKRLGHDEVSEVAKAAVAGRVARLLIEADREVPGRIDAVTGDIEFGDLEDPRIDDVLDDLGTMVWKRGGEVVVVPAERMPSKTGAAAVYRY